MSAVDVRLQRRHHDFQNTNDAGVQVSAMTNGCSSCANLHADIKDCVQDFGIRLETFLQRLEMLILNQQQLQQNQKILNGPCERPPPLFKINSNQFSSSTPLLARASSPVKKRNVFNSVVRKLLQKNDFS